MKQNPLLMKAEPVVKLALDKLGREPFVVPGFPNQVQVWLTKRVFSQNFGKRPDRSHYETDIAGSEKEEAGIA